jgi:hypothetical protein
MTTAQVGYAPIYQWVKQVLGHTHTTVVVTVSWAVLCLLVAQRVTPAALAHKRQDKPWISLIIRRYAAIGDSACWSSPQR